MKLQNFPKILKRIILWSLAAGIVMAGIIGMCSWRVESVAESHMWSDTQSIPNHRVAILLGTNPNGRNGRTNIYYLKRIKAAVELYQKGKIKRILISGDNSRKSYSEPDQMMADLIARGIPKHAIYLDYAGFCTYDSMVRAKKVFGLSECTIISQEFHNRRALYIARSIGIDADAYNAGNFVSRRWQLIMKVREALASVKAVWEVNTNKKPHFLGDPINIK